MSATTKTATLMRDVSQQNGARGVQHLYRLDPPLLGAEMVVVSAIDSAFDTGIPETYIFPADESGQVADWGELPGSYRGAADHGQALRNAGYEVEGVVVVHESAPRKAVEA
jgi:hypothetical protein